MFVEGSEDGGVDLQHNTRLKQAAKKPERDFVLMLLQPSVMRGLSERAVRHILGTSCISQLYYCDSNQNKC